MRALYASNASNAGSRLVRDRKQISELKEEIARLSFFLSFYSFIRSFVHCRLRACGATESSFSFLPLHAVLSIIVVVVVVVCLAVCLFSAFFSPCSTPRNAFLTGEFAKGSKRSHTKGANPVPTPPLAPS